MRLGWLHERAWTTDLFRDPAREIARIVTIVKAIQPPAPQPPADADTPGDGPDRRGVVEVDATADTTGAAARTPRRAGERTATGSAASTR